MFSPSALPSCEVCRRDFWPARLGQRVCGSGCARRVPVIARKAEKLDRAKTKTRLDELRPLSYWAKQAQTAFNAWIRWRDSGKPCVSCGRLHQGKVNAGHYLSRGARPELRFDEANTHLQCEPCNTNLSGNVVLYRIELIARIGLAEVERLEGPHEPKRRRADDYRAIRDEYRTRLKAGQSTSSTA